MQSPAQWMFVFVLALLVGTPLVSRNPSQNLPTAAEARASLAAVAQAAAEEDGIAVYFSPNGHCTDAVVQEIGKAKHSVRVLAYRLTSSQIDAALVAARERSVELTIVIDGAQQTEKYSDATYFANKGIPVLIDSTHAIAHNKVMVIDESVIITGSFNFTNAAEKSNAENLLVIQNRPALVKAYLTDFQKHLSHSKPYLLPAGPDDGRPKRK